MIFFKNIHKLVRQGNIKEVEKFLENKPDSINSQGKKGIPLNIAIQNSDVAMFRFLVTKGAKIDDYCVTYAIASKNISLIEEVFKLGAKPNAKAMFYNLDFDIKYTITETFLVYDSAKEKEKHENYCISVFDIAFKYGLKPNKALNFDILNVASKKSTPLVLNYLSEKGIKVEYDSKTLGKAIEECNVALVKNIAKENPNLLNKKTTDNEMPINWAISIMSITNNADKKKNLKEIVSVLVKNGADVNAANGKGRTAFYSYIWGIFFKTGQLDNSDELIKLLAEKSTNRKANILYKELLKGHSSKAPIICNNCKTVFILNDLVYYVTLLRDQKATVKCPHCKNEALSAIYGAEFANDEEWEKIG